MIGISTKSGIVLAAESRGNVFDLCDFERKPMAYYDSEFKVFNFQKFPIGITTTGAGLIAGLFTSKIIEDFIQYHEERFCSINPTQVLPILINEYISKQLPCMATSIKSQMFIIGGYLNEQQYLCFFNSRQNPNFGCVDYGYISSDRPEIDIPNDIKNITMDEAINFSIKVIENYASKGERYKTIGGPIDVLVIKPNACCWYQRKNTLLKLNNLNQFKTLFESGRLELIYIPPYSRQDVENLFLSNQQSPI